MEEGKIVLVGNEVDVLHCGYSHAISDSGKRYPSAVHYTHCMILSQLGVDENEILELLCTSSADVPEKARELLIENMPQGHDMNSLASYLQSSRQSYTMQGLRLRVEQDQAFQKALMNTNDSLLIVCDSKDRELGIGMEENQFVEWMGREKADLQILTYWMRNEHTRPPALGQNQLGFLLMWLRFEVREKRKAEMMNCEPIEVDGLSTDNDENPVKIKVNDLIIALEGIFRPLSNYYPFPFEMKGERYRSVEHYAYEKLFNALKLDDKTIEKIQTTVLPVDIPVMAERLFRKLEIPEATLESKFQKMDRWRQSAMKHKISHNDYLQQLLLSTGDALLIDTADGEPMWTCGASESELQNLLTKSYVSPSTLVNWMRNVDDKTPKNLHHLVGNKTGLLLMELRGKFASQTASRIPLISASPNPTVVSPNVLCFTAESVWHPLYPAEITANLDKPTLLPSPAHYVAHQAVKYLGFNAEDSGYVLDSKSSVECWQRLHETIESKGRGLEREQSWWMERRQKAIKESLQLLLEQHAPLLRALLDTGDALLVYCARFSSMETELSVGMREVDLRVWMNTIDMSSKQLLEYCTRPLAFRPPYLGGNRLGLILMELRREFVLRGVFPQNLPELSISADVILGTDSPAENLMASEPFDVLSPDNYTTLWINPLYILAKKRNDSELLAHAQWKKVPPRLVTMDDEKITAIVDQLNPNGHINEEFLRKVAPEDLRAVLMKMSKRLRERMLAVEEQHQEMARLAADVSRLQVLRRGLEETRDRDAMPRAAAGRERMEQPPMPLMEREIRTPPPFKKDLGMTRRDRDDREFKIQPRRFRSPTEDRGGDRRVPRKDQMDRRGRSPQSRPPPTTARSPPRKKPMTPPPVVEPPPKASKPRPPSEELSEGEILSSDED